MSKGHTKEKTEKSQIRFITNWPLSSWLIVLFERCLCWLLWVKGPSEKARLLLSSCWTCKLSYSYNFMLKNEKWHVVNVILVQCLCLIPSSVEMFTQNRCCCYSNDTFVVITDCHSTVTLIEILASLHMTRAIRQSCLASFLNNFSALKLCHRNLFVLTDILSYFCD